MKRLLLLVLVAVISSGCRKPQPSPDYIEASGTYGNLLATQGDDGYATPKMDAVVVQLGRVTANSRDYEAARALIDRITAERARIVAEKVTAAKLANPAPAPVVFPAVAAAAAPVVEAPVAAPTPPADPYALVRGADWEPIAKKFIGCVISAGPVSLLGLDGGMRTTEAFELHDSISCRDRLPSLNKNLALVQDGKIVQLTARTEIRTQTQVTPLPPLPAPTPAPEAVPAPAPAPVQ